MDTYDFSSLKNIDAAQGLRYSEQQDTYAGVLGDFHRFIEKNAGIIESAAKMRREDDYVREVHKLKSSARLIGAAELSELARELEQRGREQDWDAIERKTPQLLEKYREFLEILRPFAKERAEAVGEEMPAAELENELEGLKKALSAFDYDSSMEVLARLDGRVLPERVRETYDALHESIESFEFEEAENYVNQILAK